MGPLTNRVQGYDLGRFEHSCISKLNDSYWFHEKSNSFPGQVFSLEIEEIMHHSNSPFQDVLVFKSRTFGNVLVLNGIVQCCEKDEFAYQELITNLAVMSHARPKRVLVIGGGDCGVIRELVKHAEYGIEEITMVEIDDTVIQLLAMYLPGMACHRNHEKVNIIIEDGFEYLKRLGLQSLEKYDVIITDSSDPEGPAQGFFHTSYFELLSKALNKNGIVIMQSSENIWLNLNYLQELLYKCRLVFKNVAYSQCYMPSYTSGQLGLIVATNDPSNSLLFPKRTFSPEKEAQLWRYYSSDVHKASFVLPLWAHRILRS